MTLNRNQRRSVSVTLRLLEERLADIERMMNANERGVLYQRTLQLSPPQRAQMNELIGALRGEIRRASKRFHLPSEEQDAKRAILGRLAMSWESLEEIHPRKLEGYGAVDPALEETLEPIVKRLVRLLFDLDRAVSDDNSTD